MPALLRITLVIATCSISGIVLYFTGGLLLALSVSSYPAGVLYLLPWCLGCCGVIGLAMSWQDPTGRSARGLRLHSILLAFGLVGALLFIVLLFYLMYSFALYPQNLASLAVFIISILMFPLLPAGFAAARMHASLRRMSGLPQAEKPGLRRPLLILCSIPLVMLVTRIAAQEVVMLWYGRDLAGAAQTVAEQLANGASWCVIDHDGATSFATMDKRRILLDAVDNRMGFHGMNPIPIKPHFGILVNGDAHWWSFRQRAFIHTPWISWPVPATCPGTAETAPVR